MEKDFRLSVECKDGKYKFTSNAQTNYEHWEIIDTVAKELTRLWEDHISRERLKSKIYGYLLKNTIYLRDLRKIEMSSRTRNALYNAEINSIFHLITVPLTILKSKKGFGAGALEELKKLLESLGLHFQMSDGEVKQHFYRLYLEQKYLRKNEGFQNEGIGFSDLLTDENVRFRININDPVTEFRFSKNTLKILEIGDIFTFEDLMNCDLHELSKFRGCGPTVCMEIEGFLMLAKLGKPTVMNESI